MMMVRVSSSSSRGECFSLILVRCCGGERGVME